MIQKNNNIIAEEIKKYFLNEVSGSKLFAIMLFMTEMELGLSTVPNKWVNVKNMYFTNGAAALDYYANTRCPASQLIDAVSKDDLESQMIEMLHNYRDEDWLNENLYPYL